MYILSLVLTLLAVTGAVYLFWLAPDSSVAPATESESTSTYSDAISDAKDVAKSIATNTGAQIEVYDGIRVSSTATVLNLAGKQLTGSLKAEIRQVSQLTELNLSGNQFTGVPAEVGQLAALEVLNLSNNPITGLPHEIGNLQNLRVLDLRDTQYSTQDLEVIVSHLPDTVTVLTN